jgi:hypothetical protein
MAPISDHHIPGRNAIVSSKQTKPPRRSGWRVALPGGPSPANVIAGLALFVALGGTAAAAVTLDRDSVGSVQIRKDAVRSPEIANDAVRSPEISSGAVRSSEIRDASIRAADMSTGARTALRGELKVTEDENADHLTVPMCEGSDLSACPNRVELALASAAESSRHANPPPTQPTEPAPGPQVPETGRNWLIQARVHVSIARTSLEQQPPSGVANRCGLVDTSAPAGPRAVLDETQVGEAVRPSSENIALSAVVPKRLRNPSVALRCTSQSGDRVTASFIKITAMTVGTVAGE